MAEELTRNLGLELVRATEVAAQEAARWMGRGDKNAADQAAVQALRAALNPVAMHGVVVIGEGEKDAAPMLYVGEVVGHGAVPDVDIAVDPIDGTRLTALGLPGAIAVIAAAPRGTLYAAPPGVYYMEKIAVGPAAAGAIDLTLPVQENVRRVAAAKGGAVQDVTVVILDRPRHARLVQAVREIGARIKLITDGDVAAAIAAADPASTADMLVGIGGAPEAVLAAAAIRCLGGALQCRIAPRSEEEHWQLEGQGIDLARVYTQEDLVASEDVYFAATGITSGDLLQGVEYQGTTARTHSIIMRGQTGTIRRMEATYQRKTLDLVAGLLTGSPSSAAGPLSPGRQSD